MNEWVLIVALFSPSGEYIDKYVEGPINSKIECIKRQASTQAKTIQVRSVCVTRAHWEGTEKMPDVDYD